MDQSFRKLIFAMRDAVRAEAATVSDFDYGGMVFLFRPWCVAADLLLDHLGAKHLVVEYPIQEGGSFNHPASWHGTGYEVDCRSCAHLKIGGCMYAVDNKHGRRSFDCPSQAVTHGGENDRGCICLSAYTPQILNDRDKFLDAFISVGGADGKEDERCAFAAVKPFAAWAQNGVSLDGVNTPLEVLFPKGRWQD